MTSTTLRALCAVLSVWGGLLSAGPAVAQYASGQQNWSMSFGFPSASRLSVKNKAADLNKKSESGYYGPARTEITTIYNTDNRQNYIENNSEKGAKTEIDGQFGDDIGKNTNVVGAMNTGETTIDVRGSGNTIDATNAADSRGCLDGSVNTATSRNAAPDVPGLATLDGVQRGALMDAIARGRAGGVQHGCQ